MAGPRPRSTMGSSTRDDRGAALVEFALALPLLVILVFGIIGFGRAYNTQVAIQAGAREGARAAALGSQDVDGVVIAAAPSADLADDDVDLSPCVEGEGGEAEVVVTKDDFEILIPLIPLPDIDLQATAVMRCEV
jgi:hypothetical protein